ncbi:VanZ family protein [Flavobacterium litorale]|uniref:VanZ family protein n=1 Tax=Flavobacterium litorale TaxID=2856519 RepID=A0ABX8VFK2_9FLAO|nr:VanZ family protein [Flavobacterium litorale]QYJ69386.1 VanZ family protein [Flavobacterium litorale]
MRNIYFWAAIAWTVFVTVLCLVSMESLGAVNSFNFPNKDKFGHLTFYFVFTILWYVYFRCRKIKIKRAQILALLFAFAYGTIVEILQGLFTEARQADVMDVVFNTLGSILAIGFLLFIRKNK